VLKADNLTTFMCRLSINLGASTSWNPKGLSRPVMGLLYLLVVIIYGIRCPSCEEHDKLLSTPLSVTIQTGLQSDVV
jgi:hypothetical protein